MTTTRLPNYCCAVGVVALLLLFIVETMAAPVGSPVSPNRTLPKVEPPKTVLEFSSSPTEEEFFRARVFAEPLVPIGGKPTAGENSDLATALLGYAKRTGPD